MSENIYVIGVDMENRSAEDIAREIALKISDLTNQLIEKQKIEKQQKEEGKEN